MTINLSAPQMTELKPRIVVIGVGGAGGNAVNNMITSGLEGVDFIVANTDAQALAQSQAERRIQLGASITQGLGCGARPDVGRAAAEEAIDQIIDHMGGSHMAFITAGMGGGTGTGAAPVIAEALRDQGILTVGVVTKPFHFEGRQRMSIAEGGIESLQAFVDTLIIIPNQNLFRIANEKTTFADAFAMADNVLHSGVRGITDLMVMPGLINLDFADVRTVMGEMGKAMMGTGEAEGERRAIEAAEAAIANPLLDDVSMKGAQGVLINITGGMDLTLYEVDEAANRIREEVDPDANIIVGSALDEALNGRMRVSLVATGIDVDASIVRPSNMTPRLAAIGGRALDKAADADAESAVDIPPMAAAGVPAEAAMPETAPMAAPRPAKAAAPASMMPAPMRAVVAERAKLAPEAPDAGVFREEPAMAPMPAAEPEPAAVPEPVAEREGDLLTLSEGEQVPPPKPIQPAPEPFATARPVQVAADLPGERPFIAPEPLAPKRSHDARGQVNGWADSMMPSSDRGSEPRKGRGLAARLWRRSTGIEDQPTATVRPAEPAAPRPNRPAPAPTAAMAADIERPPLQSPAPAERTVTRNEDDDLLEIPSFLRRQAN